MALRRHRLSAEENIVYSLPLSAAIPSAVPSALPVSPAWRSSRGEAEVSSPLRHHNQQAQDRSHLGSSPKIALPPLLPRVKVAFEEPALCAPTALSPKPAREFSSAAEAHRVAGQPENLAWVEAQFFKACTASFERVLAPSALVLARDLRQSQPVQPCQDSTMLSGSRRVSFPPPTALLGKPMSKKHVARKHIVESATGHRYGLCSYARVLA